LEEHGSSRSTRSSRLARLARQSRTCRVESSQVEFEPNGSDRVTAGHEGDTTAGCNKAHLALAMTTNGYTIVVGPTCRTWSI